MTYHANRLAAMPIHDPFLSRAHPVSQRLVALTVGRRDRGVPQPQRKFARPPLLDNGKRQTLPRTKVDLTQVVVDLDGDTERRTDNRRGLATARQRRSDNSLDAAPCRQLRSCRLGL